MSYFSARLFSWVQDAAFYRQLHREAVELLPRGSGQPWLDAGCAPGGTVRAEVDRLRLLTPGDFATVRRQFSLTAEPPTADGIVALLEEECRGKKEREGGAAEMGFRA